MVWNQSPCLVQTLPPIPLSSTFLPLLHPCLITNPSSRCPSKEHMLNLSSISPDYRSTCTQPLLVQCSSSSRKKKGSYSSNHFGEMGHLFSLFQGIGLLEEETQALLDKHQPLLSSSLDTLSDRITSLQSLGIDAFALSRLITKRPDILTAQEIDPFLQFLQHDLEGDIEPEKLVRFVTRTEPRFLGGFEGKIKVLVHHGIPQDKLVYILNNLNLTKVFGYKSAQEIERTIVYLKRFSGVELIVRRPALLNIDLDGQLIPRMCVLIELSGGDEDAVGMVLRKLPAILTYSAEHLQSHIGFMRSFVELNDQEIFKIVLVYPNIFSVSKERKLQPRIHFLKQCGLNSNHIFKFLSKAPLFLSLSFEENLSKKLGFLVKIGYENRTKELAIAMGAVTRTSCQNMQKVIGVFLTFGLSCEDILAMSKKHPQILQYNHKSLEKKMEYLIEEIGREIGELLAFPAFLGYKLDDRIKHRYEEKRKILGEGMSLNKLLSVSTERFSKKKTSVPAEHT